jgi:HEPN superfamily AbiU2-like protein
VTTSRATRNPLPINERISRAVQLVLRARIFFDIWFYFEAEETRSAILDTMQEYSEFFRFMPHAHQVAFIVTIAALFDKRADTINLPQLVREMMRNKRLSPRTEAELTELISKVKPLETKITILRHKAFAHRSARTSYDDVFKEAHVTASQMRKLTEMALQIANKLAEARGMSIGFFNELPRQDAARMMLTLMKDR